MADTLTWRVRGTVERIVDGDTFVVSLDLGWGVFRKEVAGVPCRVRILNYDSPERTSPDWAHATAALAAIIPPGTVVWLVSHKLDSFGRALCEVYTMDQVNVLDVLPEEYRK